MEHTLSRHETHLIIFVVFLALVGFLVEGEIRHSLASFYSIEKQKFVTLSYIPVCFNFSVVYNISDCVLNSILQYISYSNPSNSAFDG